MSGCVDGAPTGRARLEDGGAGPLGDDEVPEGGREPVEHGQALLLGVGRGRAAEGEGGRRHGGRRARRARPVAVRAGARGRAGARAGARGQRGQRAARGRGLAPPRLLRVVHEVAARPVRTEAHGVEGAAQLRLVLGVPLQVAQLAHAVRELALVAVLAHAGLLEGAAQLGLVARGGGRRGLAGRALQAAVAQAVQQPGHQRALLRRHGRRPRQRAVLPPRPRARARARRRRRAAHRLHWTRLVLKLKEGTN